MKQKNILAKIVRGLGLFLIYGIFATFAVVILLIICLSKEGRIAVIILGSIFIIIITATFLLDYADKLEGR